MFRMLKRFSCFLSVAVIVVMMTVPMYATFNSPVLYAGSPDGDFWGSDFTGAAFDKTEVVSAPDLIDWSKVSLNERVSGTSEVSANGYYITDYIPVDMSAADPVVLRFHGGRPVSDSSDTSEKLIFYDSSKTVLGVCFIYSLKINVGQNYAVMLSKDGDEYTMDIGYGWTSTQDIAKLSYYNNIAYVRINQRISASSAITSSDLPTFNVTLDYQSGVSFFGFLTIIATVFNSAVDWIGTAADVIMDTPVLLVPIALGFGFTSIEMFKALR